MKFIILCVKIILLLINDSLLKFSVFFCVGFSKNLATAAACSLMSMSTGAKKPAIRIISKIIKIAFIIFIFRTLRTTSIHFPLSEEQSTKFADIYQLRTFLQLHNLFILNSLRRVACVNNKFGIFNNRFVINI